MQRFRVDEFHKRFPTDDVCLDTLMKLRFGDRIECALLRRPARYFRLREKDGRRAYGCEWCREQVFPTVGTIFYRSSTPLTYWFYVIYLMTASRSGVSAREVQQQLGVTYKCAWRMCHQIRKVIDEQPRDIKRRAKHVYKKDAMREHNKAQASAVESLARKSTFR